MYARGTTVRDIQQHLAEIYGTSVSADLAVDRLAPSACLRGNSHRVLAMATPIEPSAGAAPPPTNSAPPPARWLSAAGALVGVGMFLGALAVLALLVAESRGAPEAPVSTDAAHLAEAVRSGATWVSIADATEPCRYTAFTTSDTSLVYGITGGPGVDVVALTETREARACHDAPGPMVGTARLSPLDVFEGTGLGFAAFARPYVGDQLVILEPGDDPRLSWTGVAGATNYTVYRDGVLVQTQSGTTWTNTGLTNGTTYSFVVRAIDTFAQVSPDSATATFRACESTELVNTSAR